MPIEVGNVQPEEAIRSLRAKGLLKGFDWRDTDASEHVRMFTVAKALRLDVLHELHAATIRAAEKGIAFHEFQESLEPFLRKRGWWGRKDMFDPVTKEIWKNVQLGSPHRLQIIFDTNLRMSYARGRWERIERMAKRMPYLRYVGTMDGRIRPQHRAWHGTVLPWDHPWWRTHYPPNGWRCRCTVEQLSDDDLEEYGLEVSEEPPKGSGRTRDWFNKRTGRTYQVPVGIDPGFQHNVGQMGLERDAVGRLIEKIDASTDKMARVAIGRPAQSELFRRHQAVAGFDVRKDWSWPVAAIGLKPQSMLGTNVKAVRFSRDTAEKQLDNHEDIKLEDYDLVQRIVDRAFWIRSKNLPHRIIGVGRAVGRPWRVVLKVTEDGQEVYLLSLHRVSKWDLRKARMRSRDQYRNKNQ